MLNGFIVIKQICRPQFFGDIPSQYPDSLRMKPAILCNQTLDGYSLANDLLLYTEASNKQLQKKRLRNKLHKCTKIASTAKSMALFLDIQVWPAVFGAFQSDMFPIGTKAWGAAEFLRCTRKAGSRGDSIGMTSWLDPPVIIHFC